MQAVAFSASHAVARPAQPACQEQPRCAAQSAEVENARQASAIPAHVPPPPFGAQPVCKMHSVLVASESQAAAAPVQAPGAHPCAAAHAFAESRPHATGVPAQTIAAPDPGESPPDEVDPPHDATPTMAKKHGRRIDFRPMDMIVGSLSDEPGEGTRAPLRIAKTAVIDAHRMD